MSCPGIRRGLLFLRRRAPLMSHPPGRYPISLPESRGPRGAMLIFTNDPFASPRGGGIAAAGDPYADGATRGPARLPIQQPPPSPGAASYYTSIHRAHRAHRVHRAHRAHPGATLTLANNPSIPVPGDPPFLPRRAGASSTSCPETGPRAFTVIQL